MQEADPSLRSSAGWTTLLTLLTVASLVAVLVFFVPLLHCPACNGIGTWPAVDTSDADWQKKPKKLTAVACWCCNGGGRLTPYRNLTWQDPTLSNR